jgi:hypothetical protein
MWSSLIALFSQEACVLWDWDVSPMPITQRGRPGSLFFVWNLSLDLFHLGDPAIPLA